MSLKETVGDRTKPRETPRLKEGRRNRSEERDGKRGNKTFVSGPILMHSFQNESDQFWPSESEEERRSFNLPLQARESKSAVKGFVLFLSLNQSELGPSWKRD